ncbi:hypothetical protein [Giesbergeria anulus]|uniref:Uncharacterized protein n=1 Tax=Giesbergeria anulus TaxID=180197 RepID=A0A1H9KTA8_9BURK|nr:hypothetical protein [Giesbergeria anulus]SER02053.1 hypothetical protein SAMN02982919_01647 [Giesbergeria anulus]
MHQIPPVSQVLPLPAQQSVAPAVAAPGTSQAGDFLFSDAPIVNWFDAQDYATRFFWIDCASEQLGLSDYSATEQQCFAAFRAFATRGVLTAAS